MPTFGIAFRSGLFSYLISVVVSYLMWQGLGLTVAWIPMVILPVFFLVSLGKRAMMTRRPLNPGAAGWKIGFQLFAIFAVLDVICLWLYDPTMTPLIDIVVKQQWETGIILLGRYFLVIISGPIAAERFRRALRSRLGFFAR